MQAGLFFFYSRVLCVAVRETENRNPFVREAAMSHPASIGIVGSGKMAEAMIDGLLRQGLFQPLDIIASGPRVSRGVELNVKYGISVTTTNAVAAHAAVVVLAVKPQMMHVVLPELSRELSSDACIVSIAAGVSIQTIVRGLGVSGVVRAMPNTPGKIGKGITVWTATSSVSEAQRSQVDLLLRSLGDSVFVVDERYLDMATALSGSGPAYVFSFMEALVDAGVRIGLPRHLASQLVLTTVSGSVQYALQSQLHLAALRSEVTSPAGTTAEALYALDRGGFRTAILDAVAAAHQRSVQLGK